MKLNVGQTEAIKKIVESFTSGDNMFFLLGEAGTGKTLLAKKIASKYRNVMFTATTNKAVAELKKSTGRECKTIHSYLGYAMKYVGYNMQLVRNEKVKIEPCNLLIVDEASMLEKQIYNTIVNNKRLIKNILFIGDKLQLPAVNNGMDFKGINSYTLTEQMRQLNVSDFMKEEIKRSREIIKSMDIWMPNGQSDDFKIYDDFDDFAKTYNSTDGEKKIIAYRNSVIDSYNKHIIGKNLFSVDDCVVINKPLGNYRNGEILKITYAKEFKNHWDLELENQPIKYSKSKTLLKNYLAKLRKHGQVAEYRETNDKFYDIKHTFSQTCHKSQGSTIDKIFIDYADMYQAYAQKKNEWNNPITLEVFNTLIYVALSRAKKEIHLFTGKNRDYKKLKERK